jgi:hypothetical protein
MFLAFCPSNYGEAMPAPARGENPDIDARVHFMLVTVRLGSLAPIDSLEMNPLRLCERL